MDNGTYIQWKRWDTAGFAAIRPGEQYYFKQIFGGKVAENSRILEIGFGNGTLLGYFRGLGHTVVGTELNETLVAKATAAGYPAYQGTVWEIDELQAGRFDLIVALDVAEHMTHDELLKLFSWVSAHLDKAGMLCLRFPEGASPFGLAYQNGDFTHISALTQHKIMALCIASGLELSAYRDELLSSNKLCSYGAPGRLILRLLQAYGAALKWLIRFICYPLSPSLRLGTNSIAFIIPRKASDS